MPFGSIFAFLKNRTERHPTTILLSLALALLVDGPLRTSTRHATRQHTAARLHHVRSYHAGALLCAYIYVEPPSEGGTRQACSIMCQLHWKVSRIKIVGHRKAASNPQPHSPPPPPPSDKYLLTQRLHLKQGPAQPAASLPCPSPSPPSAASATVPCCTLP